MTPYPKSARNATYFTLEISEDDVFDNWRVNSDSGLIGELEIDGPKGLRAAFEHCWGEEETLSTISRTTDFGHDLLEPPLPFRKARTPPAIRKRKTDKARTPDPADSSEQSGDDREAEHDDMAEEDMAPRSVPKPKAQRKLDIADVSRPLPVRKS